MCLCVRPAGQWCTIYVWKLLNIKSFNVIVQTCWFRCNWKHLSSDIVHTVKLLIDIGYHHQTPDIMQLLIYFCLVLAFIYFVQSRSGWSKTSANKECPDHRSNHKVTWSLLGISYCPMMLFNLESIFCSPLPGYPHPRPSLSP